MSACRSTDEIAAAAARLVVEEGMEYGAGQAQGGALARPPPRGGAELPSNELVEDEVRAYLELFCADTQPAELRALRELALRWMQRLAEFRPHLSGAVWRGTATRLSSIHIDLYCDDPKAAEIALINLGVDYDVVCRPAAARRTGALPERGRALRRRWASGSRCTWRCATWTTCAARSSPTRAAAAGAAIAPRCSGCWRPARP